MPDPNEVIFGNSASCILKNSVSPRDFDGSGSVFILVRLQALFEQQKQKTLEQQTVTVFYTVSACQGKRLLLLNPPTSPPHASEGRERSLEGM